MTFLLNEQFDAALSGYIDNSGYSTVHTDIRIRTSKRTLKPVRIHQFDKLPISQLKKELSDLKYVDSNSQKEYWEIDNGLISEFDWQPTGVDPELEIFLNRGESNLISYNLSISGESAIDISDFSENSEVYVVFTASGDLASKILSQTSSGDANFAPSWMAFTSDSYGTASPDWRIMFFYLSQLGNSIGENGENIRFECTFPKSVLGNLTKIEMVKFHLYNPSSTASKLRISKIGIREPNQNPQPMDINTRNEILTRASGFETRFLENPPTNQSYKIWSNEDQEKIAIISGTLVADFNAGYLVQNAESAIEMSGKSRIDLDSDPVSLGTNFTFECWFKLTQDSVDSNRPMGLVSKYSESDYDDVSGSYNNIHGAYRIGIYNGEIVFQIGTNEPIYSSNANLNVGEWHQIAITKSSSVLRMYANGVAVYTDNNSSLSITDDPTSSFALGTWS